MKAVRWGPLGSALLSAMLASHAAVGQERFSTITGSVVAATMTGHGLKDPDTAISAAGSSPTVVEPTKEAVARLLGL